VFLPLWPNLYQELGMKEAQNPALPVNARFFSRKGQKKEAGELAELVMPEKLQIDFQVKSQAESSTPWFRFDVPMANIEYLEIKED
jgi:hypothetical protein